ncbi:MAG: PAS domain S-box protein [Myxococcota bacterium]
MSVAADLQAALAVTELVSSAGSVRDACDRVIDACLSAMGADRASVLLRDETGTMRFCAWRGLSDGYRARTTGHSPWRPDDPAPRPILVGDLAADERLGDLRDVVLAEGIRALAFVPMVHAGRLVGKFMVYFDQPHAFTEDELTLARLLAAQVAFAIARFEAEARARRTHAELEAILEGVSDAVIVQDPDRRVRFANRAASALLGRDPLVGTSGLELAAEGSYEDEDERPLPVGELPSTQALGGVPAARTITSRRPGGERRWLHVRSQPSFDEEGRVRFAVVVAQDVTQARREADARRFLYEAGGILASSLDFHATLAAVTRLAVPRLADWCSVQVVEDGAPVLLSVEHRDPAMVALASRLVSEYPPDPDAPTGAPRVLRTGVPEVTNDISEDLLRAAARDEEHLRLLRALHLTAVMVVPLKARGRVLGVISLASSESGHRFGEDDLLVATKLADRAAIAVDNARLYRDARESRARLELALEAGHLGTWELDARTGRFTWSAALARMVGREPEELAPTLEAYVETAHPDDREGVRASLVAALEHGGQHRREYRVVRADGAIRWVEARGRVELDEAGRPVRMYGARVDVTDRKAAELALDVERERLAVTLASIGDAVIATDTAGVVRLANPVAETLTGWRAEDAVGHPLTEVFRIFSEKTGVRVQDPVDKVLETGRVVGLANHTALEARDGSRRSIADSAAPIRAASGETVGVVLVFRDVTHERRVEHELAKASKLESIGVLAGGIAHDFNNILSSVTANLSLAERRLPKEHPAAKRIGAAQSACQRARDLTRQLLTFSSGGAPVKSSTSVRGLFEEACGFALQGSSVRAHFDVAADLWPIEADPGQIAQVIHNIALNAVQAMPNGGHLRIGAENVELDGEPWLTIEPGRYVRITLADDGPGIPPEILGRIFDPFFTTKAHGTGLGLATAYSIVRRHDGHIDVDSAAGDGTTFRILLPASDGRAATASPQPAPTPRGRGRVLVMDDDPSVRELAGECLEELGYEAAYAADGAEAIERYTEARAARAGFDVVVLDLTVPGGLGGRETLRRLRERFPDVRAVAFSGYSNDPVVAAYKDHGFASAMQKPFVVEDLARALYEATNKGG